MPILEAEHASFGDRPGGEVTGSKNRARDDGEVYFHLIQPTGVHGSVHGDERWPLPPKSVDDLLTAMARPLVHDPENARGGAIKFLTHD